MLTSLPTFDDLTTINGDFTISDNAVLTALPTFDDLTTINGDFTISDNAALKAISGFAVLESVGTIEFSDFLIDNNTALTTISGFDVLRKVGSNSFTNITISNNAALTSLSTFNAVTSIGEVQIVNNDALISFSGFNSLATANISITDNDALTSLPTFATITLIGFSFTISNNDALTTLPAFDTFKGLRSLTISDNDALTTISSFSALTSIRKALTISGNDALPTLSTFDVLATIGDISITDNGALTTLSGFDVLTSITGNVDISTNTTLASCCDLLRFVDGSVMVGGTTTILNNDNGCRNPDQIKADCTATRTLLPSSTTLTVNADAGTATFDVAANIPWEITQTPAATWISSTMPLTGNGNEQITIAYDENTTFTAREATLTLTATDVGTETMNIIVTQEGAIPPPPVLGLPTLAQHLRFYPNPASQTLYIEGITQETALTIRTLAGKTLLRTTLSQNEAVDIASLPQGVYLLTLQSAKKQRTGRLVIGL